MAQKKRMKLCPNCYGQVDLDVIVCPYCGSGFDADSEILNENIKNMDKEDKSFKTLSAIEMNGSLYPPPYQPKSFSENFQKEKDPVTEEPNEPIREEESQIHKDYENSEIKHSYVDQVEYTKTEFVESGLEQSIEEDVEDTNNFDENVSVEEKVEEEISIPDDKGMIAWPLILFSIGINIFVFGIFLLLFSKGGEVILKYNSNFWFLYVIAASPLLYLGIKGILIRK